MAVERIAAAFHEAYERLAPVYGWKPQQASSVPWNEVPEANRELMIAVVMDLIDRDVITGGTELWSADLDTPGFD